MAEWTTTNDGRGNYLGVDAARDHDGEPEPDWDSVMEMRAEDEIERESGNPAAETYRLQGDPCGRSEGAAVSVTDRLEEAIINARIAAQMTGVHNQPVSISQEDAAHILAALRKAPEEAA